MAAKDAPQTAPKAPEANAAPVAPPEAPKAPEATPLPAVPAEAPTIKIERVAIQEAEKLQALFKINTGRDLTLSEVIASACATVRVGAEAQLKVG
jgi:hemolysin activation/secretion protein